jgi:hypothetical protein
VVETLLAGSDPQGQRLQSALAKAKAESAAALPTCCSRGF